MILLHVDDLVIGAVDPPKVNGKPVFTSSSDFRGKKSKAGEFIYVHDVLDELYREFRRENPHPDTDGAFVAFLKQKGWKAYDYVIHDL